MTVLNVGEIKNFAVRPPREAGRHGFVYLRGQRPHEALAVRMSDTRVDGGVGGKGTRGVKRESWHGSFEFGRPRGTEGEAQPGVSVEVRSLCVF